MPTVSVKLPDETKERLDRLADAQGTTPHALMVSAIESELERHEQHESFIAAALRSLEETKASGRAYNGEEMLAYLRAKARGEKPVRPKLKSIQSMLSLPK